ncbi:sodium:solute symporter [Allorhodopirellula heiligendammensis]|uniref:Sodium/glucose cotransporter n=1 Tax=Allorhodopirellula heiligendammensis TaxID=2714739 RepID=A0A5C6BUE6_9BACT|nr:sodium:solute symporter [Allorhodopirellula heiligendammensis]TWU15883.1 Sodium/glucose cotransporter [Allorhodopirellula heiligendammensis]
MIAATFFTGVDWAVLLGYFVGILGLGLYFWRRNNSAEEFSAGGRTLSGWLCGLSIFATYLSSISYLALPGKAFVDNWNVFVYSLALPLAAAIAVRFFVPLYRHSGEVSAYSLLERRFGLWARIYASCFYLLYQIARIGVVMYLMALPMAVLFGWDIRTVILCTGVAVTVYSFVGGLVAVIWADAIQAVVLLAGALLALGILLWDMPGGPSEVIEVADAANKFSLSPENATFWDISEKTIWVIFAYGIFDNLRNFGIDQSYIQRYIAARSDHEAAKSVWFGALLYVPVSALFLFIGSSLYAYYESHPTDLQEVRVIVAEQKLMQAGIPLDAPDYDLQLSETAAALSERDLGDRVFPHFIASHLPQGARGLLIAAIFAAAMSTVSTSLNSSATLVMSDFFKRLIRPNSTDAEDVSVLRLSTIAWGVMGTMMALALIRLTESALDVWWLLSGVLGAAIIGLFLLGVLVPAIRSPGAIGASAVGVMLVAWMAASRSAYWPESLSGWASPFEPLLAIVFGPIVMVGIGCIVSLLGTPEPTKSPDE